MEPNLSSFLLFERGFFFSFPGLNLNLLFSPHIMRFRAPLFYEVIIKYLKKKLQTNQRLNKVLKIQAIKWRKKRERDPLKLMSKLNFWVSKEGNWDGIGANVDQKYSSWLFLSLFTPLEFEGFLFVVFFFPLMFLLTQI